MPNFPLSHLAHQLLFLSLFCQDEHEERAELLAKQGTSAGASKIRASMQGAPLLSDMRAFRAANPGCGFEDFVQWHSPADWSPPNIKSPSRPVLSARMSSGGQTNLWQRLWSKARPLSAARQKPLFDAEV